MYISIYRQIDRYRVCVVTVEERREEGGEETEKSSDIRACLD